MADAICPSPLKWASTPFDPFFHVQIGRDALWSGESQRFHCWKADGKAWFFSLFTFIFKVWDLKQS